MSTAPDGDVWLEPGLHARTVRPVDIGAVWDRAAADALAGGAPGVHLATDEPVEDDDPIVAFGADMASFGDVRDLLQLRRPLPIAADDPVRGGAASVPVRPFVAGGPD